jgi:hypothetical protein
MFKRVEAERERVDQLLRAIPEPPMFDGPWAAGAAGVLSLLFGFFVTLWFTSPEQVFQGPPVPARIERLLESRIYDLRKLDDRAEAVALYPSSGLRGVVDAITRLQSGQAEIAGWAANPAESGVPVRLIAFVGGKGASLGETSGYREDVSRALSLPEKASQNVAIKVAFDCPPHQTFILVAIDESGGYFTFPSRYCP